jgi:OPA family glycerol-3-phosphate transporter-like MFS transporter
MGALRDGVTTWLPSYVRDAFNMGSETAILTGAVLPIFTIICFTGTSYLYNHKFKNPMLCSGVVFGLGLVTSGVLTLLMTLGGNNVFVSLLLISLLTGSMHGVNFVLISMLPAYFRKKGNTSLMTGVLNCCVYVGSAVSTYLFPLIAVGGDWGTTVFIWFIIAVVGTLVCLFTIRPWKRFEKTLEE